MFDKKQRQGEAHYGHAETETTGTNVKPVDTAKVADKLRKAKQAAKQELKKAEERPRRGCGCW